MASQHRRAVGIFSDRPTTASALQMLNDSGFAMGHVSIIAKDADRQTAIAGIPVHDEVSNQSDSGSAVGAVTGGLLGGVTGLLVGLGTLTIPGIGPALLAGELATVFTTVAGGAAGAVAGGLVGALVGLGIPEHRAKHYRDRVAQGNYLIMLNDTEPEIARAERTLKQAGVEDWDVYHASDASAETEGDRPVTAIPKDDNRVAAGRDNPYNQVDHPMDHDYSQADVQRQAGPPHASNPLDR